MTRSLLRRFREGGDIGVLGLLYERYMHLVYGVCLKYLEDREAAKDEVMNIFEKLVTTMPERGDPEFQDMALCGDEEPLPDAAAEQEERVGPHGDDAQRPDIFYGKGGGDASYGKRRGDGYEEAGGVYRQAEGGTEELYPALLLRGVRVQADC